MINEASLLSIKEFSEITGVSQSTLRYYDQIGLFSPSARGKNNYRYYVPYQMIALHFVNVLAELGVPLAKIKSLMKDRTPHEVLSLLMERERALDRELRKLQSVYTLIHTFEHNIQASKHINPDEISIEEKEEAPVFLGYINDWDETEDFYSPFTKFCKAMTEDERGLIFPVGGYFDGMDSFVNAPSQPTRFFTHDVNGRDKMPAGHYLVGYARGYYGNMGGIAERMKTFAEKNRLKFTGAVYVMYILDEVSTSDPDEYLSRVSVRVKGVL